jgi:hypothetical protein
MPGGGEVPASAQSPSRPSTTHQHAVPRTLTTSRTSPRRRRALTTPRCPSSTLPLRLSFAPRYGGPTQHTNQPHTGAGSPPQLPRSCYDDFSRLVPPLSIRLSAPESLQSPCQLSPGPSRWVKQRGIGRDPRQFGPGAPSRRGHRAAWMSRPSSDAESGVTCAGLQSSRQVSAAYIRAGTLNPVRAPSQDVR